MTAILAIDCATEACSSALFFEGRVFEAFEHAPRKQGELLLSQTNRLITDANIKKSEIQAIALTTGPGSFTGLRLGASIAQGLACSFGIPLIPIPTLQALAQTVYAKSGEECIFTAIDARMSEVYFNHFNLDKNTGVMMPLDKDHVANPSDLQSSNVFSSYIGAGSGFDHYPEAIETFSQTLKGIHKTEWPHAKHMLPIASMVLSCGKELSADMLTLHYVRNDVAHRS